MRKDIVSAGFVALDVIYDTSRSDVPQKVTAGGSACNVAMITRFLGLDTAIIGEVGADRAGKAIREELARCGVDASSLGANEAVDTPVVIERLLKPSNGEPRHRFELRCPHCGNYFSRFRPASIRKMTDLAARLSAGVFIFDRATPGTVSLAERFKKGGSFVVFEPSSFGSSRPFRRALEISDAIKHSAERLTDIARHAPQNCIIIETKGSAGLTLTYPSRKGRQSKDFAAKYAGVAVDATGAGDWLTAGILFSLNGKRANGPELFAAIRFGQALAAMSTLFLGARGLMDEVTRRQVLRGCEEIAAGQVPHIRPRLTNASIGRPTSVCYAV